MRFLPLVPGVARAVSTAGDTAGGKFSGAGSSGSAFSREPRKIPADLRGRIFERDGHVCRYCGFVSKKYHDIHHLNYDIADHAESNLVTACIFCHQCMNLQDVNGMKSGALIWLPEISQTALNNIARAIYVARISQGPVADAARRALDAVLARREDAKARLGTDNPYILATVLSDYLGPRHYQEREKKLGGLRLLPLDRRLVREADLEFNQFPQILAYWRSKDGPFGGKAPPQWVTLFRDMREAA